MNSKVRFVHGNKHTNDQHKLNYNSYVNLTCNSNASCLPSLQVSWNQAAPGHWHVLRLHCPCRYPGPIWCQAISMSSVVARTALSLQMPRHSQVPGHQHVPSWSEKHCACRCPSTFWCQALSEYSAVIHHA